ncbi:hypothetical protein HZY62_18675 [Maribacter polysiphoniae]|uniref:Outer membrane protein with beta-barrel domain n=1 Tax=Maribacter polysiphoniae TaxID=429344 RepID=A0A316EDW9_9FLAO|nr:hypothetical protein [Maribacter polysiphoniae]MBD1262628.1 hypothetical protein [Maribacter polysiphoniae]PWK21170.1 hypothetical protein LX92_03971 [Maribacter polysiphoniae]
MKIAPITIIIIGFLLCTPVSNAQNLANGNPVKSTDLGISVQLYPAGVIPTINLERYISENSSLLFRLGGNFTDRQDFSNENDHEEGSGFGGSFGYRRHFPFSKGKMVAGLHLDAWNLWIDWEDSNTIPISGTTYILVLQPWLETGYFFPIKNSSSQIGITAGFGREVNAITSGEEVAQDWIASLLLHYQFSLN